MKVLVIHRYFWPEEISTLPVMLRDLVRIHIDHGDDVTVVTGNKGGYDAAWCGEFQDNVKIACFDAELDRKSSNARRLINMMKLAFLSIRNVIRGRPDVIYTVTYPPGFSAFIVLLAKIFVPNSKVIFYIQDILTYRLKNSLIRSCYVRLFAYTCRYCHRAITLTEDMRDEIFRIVDVDESSRSLWRRKVCVIPNYSPDLYSSSFEEREKRYDIVYAGNHGEAQNLEHFLHVIANMNKVRSPSVVFYGDGTQKRKLEMLAQELGVEVRFNSSVSRVEVSQKISEASFGLVGAVPGLMRYAFPSKLAAYNAAGIPGLVMCSSNSGMSRWLRDEGVGMCLDPSDVGIAALQLEQAIEASGNYKPAQVRYEAERLYSLESYKQSFSADILNSLL